MLKQIIQERTSFIVGDCNTFIMARGQNPSALTSWNTGGGNFLMAVGLFAVLNFLGKMYRHLTYPEAFTTAEDKQQVVNAKATLRTQHPEMSQILRKWQNPRVGEIDETRTFINLVNALPATIDMGFSEDITPDQVWRTFRNYLTHMAWPNSAISTFNFRTPPITLSRALEAVENDVRKPFYIEYGVISCNSDKLSVALTQIANWLCAEIGRGRFSEENIASSIEWANI